MNALAYDSTRTSLTLVNGELFDLLAPQPALIDFEAIFEQLAKANRYCGATPHITYSVAEHSERCAEAALRETGDEVLAKYLLCHDMHEAFLGDDTTPKKRALSVIMASFGVLAGEIEQAFEQLTDRIDAAIHARVDLAWPAPPEMAAKVKFWDRKLLATEWRDLMRCAPPYDFGVDPLSEEILPYGHWLDAQFGMLWKFRDVFGDDILKGQDDGGR